jgi:Xaa-Pro aminopeptidase
MPNGLERSQLAEMQVAARLGRLRAGLEEASCDALLVTSLVNIRYLTSFSGSTGMLLVGPDETLFVSDGRYRDQSAEEFARAGVEVSSEIGRPAEQLAALDQALKGVSRLGVEAEHISWASEQRLATTMSTIASGLTKVVPTRALIEALRVVKDDGELARIELAAEIADVALAQVKEHLTKQVSEQEFALELDFEMRRRGADGVAFETIVASGPNSALPHARPSDRRILAGDVVVVDFGAEVDGYRSDMTRMLCAGTVASPEMQDLLDAVLVAQRAGVRALKPGSRGGDVDAACRESLSAAGYGDVFLHGTGHGVGLEIHEAPAVTPGGADILEEGAVVTVEPGAYLQGLGGVRIEDTLVITPTGARTLTKSTKDTFC